MATAEKVKELQLQIKEMTKQGNRRVCPQSGVNFMANLDMLHGEASGAHVDLAAKAQAAMVSAKRQRMAIQTQMVSQSILLIQK